MSQTIKKVFSDTWIIEEEGVRYFLLEGENEAALIDSGMQYENAKEIAEGLTTKPIRLLNTHADRDHIRGNGAFEEVYIGVHECAFYAQSQPQGQPPCQVIAEKCDKE